jgi:hypothetical protein
MQARPLYAKPHSMTPSRPPEAAGFLHTLFARQGRPADFVLHGGAEVLPCRYETGLGQRRRVRRKRAWVVDYVDQAGKRHLKTFTRKKDAEAYRVSAGYQVSRGTHTAVVRA